jgi:hypothetical protein
MIENKLEKQMHQNSMYFFHHKGKNLWLINCPRLIFGSSVTALLLSLAYAYQSRTFLYVVFEWFGQIVPEIAFQTNIGHCHSWIETIHGRFDWNFFACINTINTFV